MSDFTNLGPDGPQQRPRIVCLCGSTRFKGAFEEANRAETLAGRIVLSVGYFVHADNDPATAEQKAALDRLHKHKIDLADEILVLNCKAPRCGACGKWYFHATKILCANCGGFVRKEPYIGDSTRSEIEYAEHLGKPVRYLEAAP